MALGILKGLDGVQEAPRHNSAYPHDVPVEDQQDSGRSTYGKDKMKTNNTQCR